MDPAPEEHLCRMAFLQAWLLDDVGGLRFTEVRSGQFGRAIGEP